MEILIGLWEKLKAFFASSATGNLIQFAILVALIVGYIIITKPWQRRFVKLFQQRYEDLINEVDFSIDKVNALRAHASSVYDQNKSQSDEIPYPPFPQIYRRKEEIDFLELPGWQTIQELRELEPRSKHLENLNILKFESVSENQTQKIIIQYSQLVQFYGILRSDQWILNEYILRVNYGDIEGTAHFKDETRERREVRAKKEHIEGDTIKEFYIKREGFGDDFYRNWKLLSYSRVQQSEGWKSIARLRLRFDAYLQSEFENNHPRVKTVYPAKEGNMFDDKPR